VKVPLADTTKERDCCTMRLAYSLLGLIATGCAFSPWIAIGPAQTRSQIALLPPPRHEALISPSRRRAPALALSSKDWDAILAEDDDSNQNGRIPAKPDMQYNPRNIQRQHHNFVAIREAGGPEVTNDVYVPEPNSEVFWFVGKVARISDVSVEQVIARQWPLIEQHAANLRPIELYPSRGRLEIWYAPGDSEMEVAYNRPDLVLQKAFRDAEGADSIKHNLIGFQGEMYQGGEEGFRTRRKSDGSPVKPEIQSPNANELQAPTEDDMERLEKELEGKDINEVYKEQQRRYGNKVDDD
jgi:hypothetical protein